VPHWRDPGTLSAFPRVGATSLWYRVFTMHCWYPYSQSGSHPDPCWLAPRFFVIQEGNSNCKWRLSIRVLRDRCVWVLCQRSFWALGILHHHCTYAMDQDKINQIQKQLLKVRECCAVFYWVLKQIIMYVWHSIVSRHTLDRSFCIRYYKLSCPQDYYTFHCPSSWTITTSRKEPEYVLK
jgi:hypothetical protein